MRVTYEGRDINGSFCFKNEYDNFKIDPNELGKISDIARFKAYKNYDLELIGDKVTSIKELKVKESIRDEQEIEKIQSKLMEKIELREVIKRKLRLKEEVSELIERLAELQGEDETVKFIEKANIENKEEIRKNSKNYIKNNKGNYEYVKKVKKGKGSNIIAYVLGGIIIFIMFLNLLGRVSHLKKETSISLPEAKIYSESFLKRNMKDSSSFEVIRNQKISGTEKNVKMLVMYRAKNSFGGYAIETKEVRVYIVDGEIRTRYVN